MFLRKINTGGIGDFGDHSTHVRRIWCRAHLSETLFIPFFPCLQQDVSLQISRHHCRQRAESSVCCKRLEEICWSSSPPRSRPSVSQDLRAWYKGSCFSCLGLIHVLSWAHSSLHNRRYVVIYPEPPSCHLGRRARRIPALRHCPNSMPRVWPCWRYDCRHIGHETSHQLPCR